MKEKNSYHIPVMLHEVVEGMNIVPGGIYVDATFGGGGHAAAILNKMKGGKFFAFDRDADAHENKIDDERLVMFQQDFRYMKRFLDYAGCSHVDGILADLGVSSHQFDIPERGFSTRFDSTPDMRMDRNSELSAKEVLNTYSEEALVKIFSAYGELNNSGRMAREIIRRRSEKSIESITELKEILKSCAVRGKENKFFAQVFQALRIEVNQELDALKEFLIQSAAVLKEGGRLLVISYHSLEDRLVKNFISQNMFEGKAESDIYGNRPRLQFEAVTKKPMEPSAEEIENNPRARSAKLRIAIRRIG